MRAAALTAALTLALASGVQAQNFREPPPEYDRPYPGGTSLRYYPKAEMWDRCIALLGRKLPNQPAECAKVRISRQTGQKRCFVFIAEHFRGGEDDDLLFRHGRAHCNGWWHPPRKQHPQ